MMSRIRVAAALVILSAIGCTTTPAPLPTLIPGQTAGPSGVISSPGSSLTAAAPIAQKSACELIFKDEAAAAIGVSIEVPQEVAANSDEGGWLSDCAYWRRDVHDQAPLDLTLASGATYLARFEDVRAEDGVSPLPGVGDEALFRLSTISGLDGPIGALFVRVGNSVIGLSLGIVDLTDTGGMVLAGDGAKQQQILVDLAGIAVGRLTSPPVEAAKTCELISLEQAAGILGLALTSLADVDNRDAWGAECQYNVGNEAELFVTVNAAAAGRQNFDTCKTGSETVLGVGEEAFYTQPGLCAIQGGGMSLTPLLVRSGGTIVAVAEGGRLEHEQSRVALVQLARLALQQLGLDPGTAPRAVTANALLHPCTLAADTEVSNLVGATIASHAEWPADTTGINAQCLYDTADLSIIPLSVTLGHGQPALSNLTDLIRSGAGAYTPVAGIGDVAWSDQSDAGADYPLVGLTVRDGEAVLELRLGPVGQSADRSSYIAPGTPEQQLEMLRRLAGLIIPRLYTPNTTPSPSPNSGASLSLHVEVSHLGARFEADGRCDIGPDDAWLELGFQRDGQPEEYLTVGPAPNGVGGMSPKGGGVFHADSVRIAVYDSASSALVFADNALAVLQADLRGGSFNGLWNGRTVDLFYTCQ